MEPPPSRSGGRLIDSPLKSEAKSAVESVIPAINTPGLGLDRVERACMMHPSNAPRSPACRTPTPHHKSLIRQRKSPDPKTRAFPIAFAARVAVRRNPKDQKNKTLAGVLEIVSRVLLSVKRRSLPRSVTARIMSGCPPCIPIACPASRQRRHNPVSALRDPCRPSSADSLSLAISRAAA